MDNSKFEENASGLADMFGQMSEVLRSFAGSCSDSEKAQSYILAKKWFDFATMANKYTTEGADINTPVQGVAKTFRQPFSSLFVSSLMDITSQMFRYGSEVPSTVAVDGVPEFPAIEGWSWKKDGDICLEADDGSGSLHRQSIGVDVFICYRGQIPEFVRMLFELQCEMTDFAKSHDG